MQANNVLQITVLIKTDESKYIMAVIWIEYGPNMQKAIAIVPCASYDGLLTPVSYHNKV